MVEIAATLPSDRSLARLGNQTGYGPYLLIEAMPWLFLAITLRTLSFYYPAVGFLFFYSAQFILLLALLIASQRMIEIAGGVTGLGRLSMPEQWRLSWDVVWRLSLAGAVVGITAHRAGMDPAKAVRFMQGFDGIAFNRFVDLLLCWSPLFAVVAFLMLVEKGMGRTPTLRAALWQFVKRWRPMLWAALLIMPCFAVINWAQGKIGYPVQDFIKAELPPRLHFISIVLYLFAFAYLRLWLTVALLTYGLRRSYRSQSSD